MKLLKECNYMKRTLKALLITVTIVVSITSFNDNLLEVTEDESEYPKSIEQDNVYIIK